MKSVIHSGSNFALVLIALALFLISCHVPVDELAGRYRMVTSKPDKAALLGTWTIDKATIEYMRTRGRYDVSRPTKITLRDDQSFEMTDMPDWYGDGFGESHGRLVNLNGKWSLDENSGFWTVRLVIPTASGPESGPQLDLREPRYSSQPRYLFEIVIGDPDSREGMILTKS